MKKNELSIVKDTVLMPPPKALTKSRSDMSDELRRNLIETEANRQENSIIKEELKRIKNKERENIQSKYYSDSQSYNESVSIYTYIKNKNIDYKIINKCNFQTNQIGSDFEDFDSNCDLRSNSMEKLKNGLINDTNDNDNYKNLFKTANYSLINKFSNEINFKKYIKLPKPNNKKQIQFFFKNIISYLNYLIDLEFTDNHKLTVQKIQIETRFNDYKNKGLCESYFIYCLLNFQDDLIKQAYSVYSKINNVTTKIKEDKVNEDYYLIHQNEYTFLDKKRKRNFSISDIKSVTNSSSDE